MKIGNYDLYSVETSEFGLDGGAMFGIIPKPVWEKKVSADELNRVNMVTRSLLLVSCLLYTSPSPRDRTRSRMPSSA